MNYHKKTKDELIQDLRELQIKFDSLKKTFSDDLTGSSYSEKAMRESEQKCKLLCDNSVDAILLTSPDGLIFSANPAACRMFNMSEEEICKLGRNGIIDLNDPKLQYSLDERRNTGKSKAELILLKKDGTRFQAEVTSRIFRDAAGNERTSMIIRDITERKQAENALTLQNKALKRLNNFSMELSKLSLKDDLEVFITRQLKKITGAVATTFSEYSQTKHNLTTKHIEIEPGLLKKAIGLLGRHVAGIQSEVSDEMYNEMTKKIIGMRKTLFESAFGAIPRAASATLQALLKADRFIGIAYLTEGKLYGTSLIAMSRDKPDTPREILESFSYLAAVSLRRKQAEKAKHESDDLFRTVISNAPISIFATNEKGIFILHEGKALEKVGMKTGENIGVPAFELFAELKIVTYNDEVINGESVLKRVLKGERLSGFTEINGVHFDNQFVPIIGINNKVIGIIGVATDITEYKLAEANLRESEAKFRSLFESSLIGISIASADGILLQANPAYARIYGYENPEIMFAEVNNVRRLYANPEDRKEVLGILHSKGFMEAKEFEVIRRDGSRIFVLVSACEIRDNTDKLLYVQAAHIDLTERKNADEEIRKSKKLLVDLYKHLNEIRENERASISREIHDQIGQSLTALKLDLNQMNMYINSNPEAETKLERMVGLISETIKDVQRISSDLRPGILDDLGLAAAIEWYSDEFEKRAGIKCRLKLGDSVVGDPQKNLIFFRVLQEALTNIIRHANASAVTIELNQTKKGMTLAIRDNGIGIAMEKIESAKSLGLIGMRERVRQFGGKIDISSKEGSGTKLIIFVPEK